MICPSAISAATDSPSAAQLELTPTVARNFGVNIHSLQPSAQEIDLLLQANLRTVRTDFAWDQTEKRPGVYDFSAQEGLLTRLAPAHIRWIMVLAYSNALYGPDGKPPYSTAGRQAFARWAAGAAHHFAGRDIIWEIWNEPNGKWFWPNPDPHAYSQLAIAASQAMRRADPNCIIIGPALYGVDLNYLETCFKDGCLNYFNAITIHPYRSNGPETVGDDYRRVRELIDRYAQAKSLSLLQGEWGYQTKGPSAERDRAKLVLRIFLTDLANRIPLSIWYDWIDDNESMGIVKPEKPGDNSMLEPEAGYIAVKTLTHLLGPYRFDSAMRVGEQDKDCALSFQNGDHHCYVAWTTRNQPTPINITVPNGSYTLINALAEQPDSEISTTSNNISLTVTDIPTYIIPVDERENLAAAPSTQPVDLKDNPAVQKALADEETAIQLADADYAKKLETLNAARQKKVDAAKLACVAALRRAEIVSNALNKTDEGLAIGALADSIKSEVGSTKLPVPNGGWTVLFHSADPSIWDTNTNRGQDSFAISLDSAPQGVQFLKLARPNGDSVIIPMDNAHLGKFQSIEKGRFGWEGECPFSYKAFHLGVFSRDFDRPRGCVDITGEEGGIAGWGFGNHNQLGDTQGFGWEGQEIGSTVFEISVKTTPLSGGEEKNLK